MTDRSTWKCKAAAGRFTVWHAGKNCYFVTDGRDGQVLAQRDQYGPAFTAASRFYELDKAAA